MSDGNKIELHDCHEIKVIVNGATLGVVRRNKQGEIELLPTGYIAFTADQLEPIVRAMKECNL